MSERLSRPSLPESSRVNLDIIPNEPLNHAEMVMARLNTHSPLVDNVAYFMAAINQ